VIGIIITGHGGFASGLEENLKMLVGNVDGVVAIPFEKEMSFELYDEKISSAMDRFAGVPTLVFTDITGGTPFNRAAMLSLKRENVRVLGGANAAMLVDTAMRSMMDEEIADMTELAEDILASGRENMSCYKLSTNCVEVADMEAGI